MTQSLVGEPPPLRRGKAPKLEDKPFRKRTLELAATGLSRRGVAHLLGMDSTGCLYDWLARGKAQPDVEPYGSWAADYLAAERAAELIGTTIQSAQLAHIARKSPQTRTPAELAFVDRLLATRYPRDHGNASAGTGNARVEAPEPDAEAWWQKHGLVGDQLRALMRDPPESVAAAQIAEMDAIYARALGAGWKPKGML